MMTYGGQSQDLFAYWIKFAVICDANTIKGND